MIVDRLFNCWLFSWPIKIDRFSFPARSSECLEGEASSASGRHAVVTSAECLPTPLTPHRLLHPQHDRPHPSLPLVPEAHRPAALPPGPLDTPRFPVGSRLAVDSPLPLVMPRFTPGVEISLPESRLPDPRWEFVRHEKTELFSFTCRMGLCSLLGLFFG